MTLDTWLDRLQSPGDALLPTQLGSVRSADDVPGEVWLLAAVLEDAVR